MLLRIAKFVVVLQQLRSSSVLGVAHRAGEDAAVLVLLLDDAD